MANKNSIQNILRLGGIVKDIRFAAPHCFHYQNDSMWVIHMYNGENRVEKMDCTLVEFLNRSEYLEIIEPHNRLVYELIDKLIENYKGEQYES